MKLPRNFLPWFVQSFFLAGAAAYAEPVAIGYKECLAATNAPGAAAESMGQLKWYFAHASVGENMMEGIADLHQADGALYRFERVAAGATPPTAVKGGVIYEHNRGNPGWKAKLDQFASCVNDGWQSPRVNLAMNKLCYIDQNVSARYYIDSMTKLEAAHPGTIFVYTTMPLMTSEDNDNILRNVFNQRVREFCRANNRVLFDIADIQSHDRQGAPCTFKSKGRTWEKLHEGYSTDGGHLNADGRRLLARGFYALSAALLASDAHKERLVAGAK